MQQADKLEFRYSRAKLLGLIGICALLVAVSWSVAAGAPDDAQRAMGWIGTAFFGLCGLAIGVRFLRGGTRFVFDRSGITANDLGFVPWEDVQSCSAVEVADHRFLSLTLRDPERLLMRLSPLKRRLADLNGQIAGGDWTLTFSGVRPGIDEALDFIRQYVPRLSPQDPPES